MIDRTPGNGDAVSTMIVSQHLPASAAARQVRRRGRWSPNLRSWAAGSAPAGLNALSPGSVRADGTWLAGRIGKDGERHWHGVHERHRVGARPGTEALRARCAAGRDLRALACAFSGAGFALTGKQPDGSRPYCWRRAMASRSRPTTRRHCSCPPATTRRTRVRRQVNAAGPRPRRPCTCATAAPSGQGETTGAQWVESAR